MLIGSDSINFGIKTALLEPDFNRDASEYVKSHYKQLLDHICKIGIKEEKASDLLHDVYVSIVESENNNKGFDMEYGEDEQSDGFKLMDVSQFVYGRICLYAKNPKYRTDVIETGTGVTLSSTVVYVDELNARGKPILNSDGTIRKVRKTIQKKEKVSIATSAASFNTGDNSDNNDGFQTAYAMAETADSTDDITEMLSLREQIDFCIDIASTYNIQILNLFKNIDMLADMLSKSSKRTRAHEQIFSMLHEAVCYHSEFAESLISVLDFSSKNRSVFDAVILSY